MNARAQSRNTGVVFVVESDSDVEAMEAVGVQRRSSTGRAAKRARVADTVQRAIARPRNPRSGPASPQEPTEVVDLTVDTDSPKARRTELSRGKGAGPSVGALSFDVRDPPRADAKQPVPTCPICLENIKAMSCGPCGYALLTVCARCRHVFCEECLRACVKQHKRCPTCRKAMQLRSIHRVYLD